MFIKITVICHISEPWTLITKPARSSVRARWRTGYEPRRMFVLCDSNYVWHLWRIFHHSLGDEPLFNVDFGIGEKGVVNPKRSICLKLIIVVILQRLRLMFVNRFRWFTGWERLASCLCANWQNIYDESFSLAQSVNFQYKATRFQDHACLLLLNVPLNYYSIMSDGSDYTRESNLDRIIFLRFYHVTLSS